MSDAMRFPGYSGEGEKFCPSCAEMISPDITEAFVPGKPENTSGQLRHGPAIEAHFVGVAKCPHCKRQNLYKSKDEYLNLLTVKERQSYSKTEVEL